MSVIKISELTNVETPVSTDVLPIVNDGETKKITLEQLANVANQGIDLTDYAKTSDVESMISDAITGALEGSY